MRPGRITSALLICCAAALLVALSLLTQQQQPLARAHQPPASEPRANAALHPRAVTVRILFGLRDREATDWSGELELSEGQVLKADIWRSGAGDQLIDNTRFQLRTHTAAAGRRRVVTENGLLLTLDAPRSAELSVTTKQGEFRVPLAALAAQDRLVRLERQVSIDIVATAATVAATDREEDFPAAAAAEDGTVYACYLEHAHLGSPDLNPLPRPLDDFSDLQPAGGGDRLMMVTSAGGGWSQPLAVTEDGLDLWRPALAIDGSGTVCCVWSQNVDGNWELLARRFDPQKRSWSRVERLTESAGADVNVVAARGNSGTVWIAWQAWREGDFDIHLAALGPQGLVPKGRVAAKGSNQWSPAIAADQQGNIHVAYDTYEEGNYDIRLVTVQESGSAADRLSGSVVAGSRHFEVRPSLVCDPAGRVWIAWEERTVNWGKDDWGAIHAGPGSALYRGGSTVRVACLTDGRLRQTAGDLLANFQPRALESMNGYPRLGVDPSGRVWLALRHREQRRGPMGTFWQSYLTTYEGNEWSAPTLVPYSDNLLDNRPVLLGQEAGRMLVIYSGDGRNRYTQRPAVNNQLFAGLVTRGETVAPAALVDAADGTADPEPVAVVHPNEPQDVARIREHRFQVAGRAYQLMRGEFHRHTEISGDGGGDGSLEDMWRYGLDAARMDWIGNGDHDNGGGREYTWWITQKTTDIFHHAPAFVPMFTYERSVRFPDGHRNVMFAQRGIRTLPRVQPQAGENKPNNVSALDTPMLYRYLKRFDGICAVHTSATDMGTDWRDNDPAVEPFVEIYQGDRHNYEHFGAPRAATAETQVGGFQPDGFVWNALEKGYRLGFQASSDHISTHISYAVALVEQPTREGILDAFKRRHCYAATDNIILVVSCEDHLMGDEFSTGNRPSLQITAIGTAPIERLSIVRDLSYVYATGPGRQHVEMRWTDEDPAPGKSSLYYVRVEQEDGQIAWASPMWITYEP